MNDPGEVTGTATLQVTMDLATYDRLADLLRVAPASVVIARLLDRDPHDHAHRCPTCARRANLHVVEPPEQDVLFA